ncbi:MAG: HupE/UreJ family protein [Gemmatimonadetes bacterium]|nr:HupE/UreJ family protein [Gemmatimonadota bacterium]
MFRDRVRRAASILRPLTRWRPAALGGAPAGFGPWRHAIAAILALATASAAPAHAHEIPKSVHVLAYIRADATTLRVIARVPLEAMRDIQWPLRGPGYLVLSRADSLLADGVKLWLTDNLTIFEDGRALPAPRVRGTRIALQSDTAFRSFAAATAGFATPALGDSVNLAWQQAMVDVSLEYEIGSPESAFSLDARFARLGVRTTTELRIVQADSTERTVTWLGDPGRIQLDPSWWQAASQFVALGFRHILDGLDHLLFLVCLVVPFRRIRPLVVIVTAFTAAHALTMSASALGFAPDAAWFPPLIELLIAASIVYAAIENVFGANIQRRWMIAFGFGLVHGFGFAFALRESLQFSGSHVLAALAAFNIGVEAGQVLVVALAAPLLTWVIARLPSERVAIVVISALVAHTAWHWLLERGADLREYDFTGQPLDMLAARTAVRLAIIGLGAFLLARAARPWVNRALEPRGSPAAPPAA